MHRMQREVFWCLGQRISRVREQQASLCCLHSLMLSPLIQPCSKVRHYLTLQQQVEGNQLFSTETLALVQLRCSAECRVSTVSHSQRQSCCICVSRVNYTSAAPISLLQCIRGSLLACFHGSVALRQCVSVADCLLSAAAAAVPCPAGTLYSKYTPATLLSRCTHSVHSLGAYFRGQKPHLQLSDLCSWPTARCSAATVCHCLCCVISYCACVLVFLSPTLPHSPRGPLDATTSTSTRISDRPSQRTAAASTAASSSMDS